MTLLDRTRHLHELQVAERDKSVPFYDPLPHQLPPEGDWFMWLLEAGRGAGKTAAAAHYVIDHVNGPPCISKSLPHRIGLIAPTLGDAIESADLNDMAITRIDPTAKFTASAGGAMVKWPNGSQLRLFGTNIKRDTDRLRSAGNRCLYWLEELASWPRMLEAWETMILGLRVGPNPRIVATTTPKPRPAYMKIRETADHVTTAEMDDNPHLNAEQKKRLYDLYGGTSLGVQELEGRLIKEAEGALWTTGMIDDDRIPDLLWREDEYGDLDETWHPLGRGVVAVDPPGGATEAGIVAAALIPDCPCGGDRMPHFAVVDDRSGKLTPEGWGARSVGLLQDWQFDRIVGEINYGGDMVESIIRQQDPNVAYKPVRASRGKRVRAEPIKALYEQHRVHHVGTFPELEAEMALWVPDESEWSPNRLDALVWALTDLAAGRLLDGNLMV